MTEQEIQSLNDEFSNEFDVLYNNITSNQAPGLDEYEKSVFLTKALDEIIKYYFNPKTNKVHEGFDGNERRQIDFSMLMESVIYSESDSFYYVSSDTPIDGLDNCKSYNELIELLQKGTLISELDVNTINSFTFAKVKLVTTENGIALRIPKAYILRFVDSFFDMRSNTKAVSLETDILMFVNEYVLVTRGNETVRLTVIPINYDEYSRLMSKPLKRPIKGLAWRLLDNSNGSRKAEIIIGPNDTLLSYVIRYVKRPRAIRLTTFDNVTIDGGKDAQCCELDPILFPEIIQRACELAKAAYIGDLTSQIALGQTSHTDIGIAAQNG